MAKTLSKAFGIYTLFFFGGVGQMFIAYLITVMFLYLIGII